MNLRYVLICILIIVSTTTCTLSPNSKQKKSKIKSDSKKGPVNQNAFDRDLVVKDPESVDILKQAGFYYKASKEKSFTNEVLGYITPWNGEGYEVTKTFHGKFTSVSPVWFTVAPSTDEKFQIPTNDVQKKWLKEFKSLNSEHHTVRILPRVLFNGWSTNDISLLNSDNEKKNQLISALTDTAKTFQFNGYVLEIWNQFISTGINTKIVINLITSISKKLKNKNLEVVLAIPPELGSEARNYFEKLAPSIDYFSLMTYDFSNVQRPGPNSPLDWARDCVKKLVPNDEDPRRAQILLGINFYGNNYTPEGGGPILGHEYLKLLEHSKGKIQWDSRSKEHFFEYRSSTSRGIVFYPTLYSLQQRIDLARELGTGISIWELGQGLNYFYDLF